jgi:hypothetical protein
MKSVLLACTLALLLPSLAAAVAPPPDTGPDFDRVIAPLLARRCLDCHAGPSVKGKLDLASRRTTFAGGKSGPALVPGNPDQSYLWERVRDEQMPPKKPLPEAEKALLRAWITGGARWGSDPIDPFRISTEHRAGLDWWSLQPLQRPAIPSGKSPSWGRNPIDRFLLARLEEHGLAPSPDADRRTLIRRLSFDLIGLPPTPEEVEAFLTDGSPNASEKLVDRLLASPHYGERWARHWLDVVRFGESDGYERDLPRFTAWPYRDWVIDALNRDLPYDQFARVQLAGDVLQPGDPGALAATGFLVAGPHDVVVPVVQAMRDSMRQDEMEDIIGTVGQTFLGLTVNCARCHDHKFDPVSQKDYYRLAAALSGVGHGERVVPSPGDALILARLRQRIDQIEGRLTALETPHRLAILAGRTTGKIAASLEPLAEWDFRTGLQDRRGELHGSAHGSAQRTGEGIKLDGRTGYAATAPLKAAVGARTLEAWVRLEGLEQRGGGVMSLQTLDGATFDAIVFGEQEPRHWMAGSNFFRRTRSVGGPAETEANKRVVHLAITYAQDGTITLYRDGLPYGSSYRTEPPVTFPAGGAQVVFGLRHAPVGGNKMLAATVVRARLHDRALSAAEVAASSGDHVSEQEMRARLSGEERARWQEDRAELARLSDEMRRIEARMSRKVYAVVSFPAGATHVLLRGNVTTPGERVEAEPLSALARSVGSLPLPADAPEGERRRALAVWMTSQKNPLFARVMVNRLWHYHFGAGLVETPNDLGFHGGRPSHPELLDWLASEFIDQGWSLKALHRLIVTSAAYRQSSAPREDALKRDAGNRFLWRRSPERLEAEAVRDAMLSVAGRLDQTVGGAHYQDFRTYFFKGTQFYEAVEQIGPAFGRRTIYRMWARGGRNPFLDTFDCPDPSTTTPRRAATTTPLQALSLLNNALVLDLADTLAGRLRLEAGSNPEQQIERLFRLAYGRTPSRREQALVRPFVERHGLAALCRVVFNSNEFMQVD